MDKYAEILELIKAVSMGNLSDGACELLASMIGARIDTAWLEGRNAGYELGWDLGLSVGSIRGVA